MLDPPYGSWDNSCRLEADRCVAAQRDRANRYAAGYTLTNLRPASSHDGGKDDDRRLQQPRGHLLHRSMRTWDGYGWSSAAVDGDTELRLDARATHPRSRMQLNARVFCAVPALAKGRTADPALESRLVLGSIDTSATRECFPIGEVDFQRFDPGVCEVSVEHIVPAWTAGGEDSRHIARSRNFRRAVRQYSAAAASDAAAGCAPAYEPSPGHPFEEPLAPAARLQEQQKQMQMQMQKPRMTCSSLDDAFRRLQDASGFSAANSSI